MANIEKLKHCLPEVAEQIYSLFQRAYRIEAEVVDCDEQYFPPLLRSQQDIQRASTAFYGLYLADRIAGIVEMNVELGALDIESLVVSPEYFRQGVAGSMLTFALGEFEYRRARVETAAANMPAIALYKKYGFIEYKTWTPSHGVKKVALEIISSCN
ncbi:GNAT family N-acetyltransferase [Aestuariibacter sp. AA17]|uniref:GNAT family N-acetyltransferase n=1 Tax=Fluctibacter corallii TaxID=2984329 RepID=A0ABT3A4Q9_9ALTE|nr:GNAT family N-acetyltransferase [Aestuariibacter sp. AA17]MCV2883683.1 GNAT family N-acetyltransferase [Aestuariibacter sp. AA17]